MVNNPTALGINEALDLLKKREISALELVQQHLDRINQYSHLNAFTCVTAEHALNQARRADERYSRAEAKLLDGIPIGVKDLFCTNGVETSACSMILRGFKPPYESGVTELLFANGGIMVGKTNMDEFAMGSANITSAYGHVINPKRRANDLGPDLVPGGSSGGSAAAVAAMLAMGALGSDTGGSIRQPAAFTGTVGVKPTYGSCSRYGMIAFSSSLDQAGVFARSVADAAVLLEAIVGYDERDSTSVQHPGTNFLVGANTENIKGLKVGVPKEYRIDGMPHDIESMWQDGINWLKVQGAEIVEISLPHTKYALPTYYIVACAEASSNLARYDGVRFGNRVSEEKMSLQQMYEATRSAGFGAEVKRRIMIGTYVLSAGYYDAYYTRAQKVRRLIKHDFDQAFTKVDAILTPAAPSEAFAIGQKIDDPITMYLNDVFTVPASLSGLPCISVPAAFSSGAELPLGLQVIAKPFDEMLMFKVSAAIERAAGLQTRLKNIN
jgi:aspartyl-tRNA(Asn)/glutamyl-tRNA(Gln) amidotransferase subunit A